MWKQSGCLSNCYNVLSCVPIFRRIMFCSMSGTTRSQNSTFSMLMQGMQGWWLVFCHSTHSLSKVVKQSDITPSVLHSQSNLPQCAHTFSKCLHEYANSTGLQHVRIPSPSMNEGSSKGESGDPQVYHISHSWHEISSSSGREGKDSLCLST